MHSQCSIAKSNSFFLRTYNRRGYITTEDLKEVFTLLGESVTDDEVNSKIIILNHFSYDNDSWREV